MSEDMMSPRITRGRPDVAETAALTVVLAALSARTAPESTSESRSMWSTRTALLRKPSRPGPDAWRASGLPS